MANEITAAFLWAQFEDAEAITARRCAIWNRYHEGFADLEADGLLRRPVIPAGRTHNAHMYYLLLPGPESRAIFTDELLARQIVAVFHYVPLHTAPGGQRLGRAHGELVNTDQLSARLVRLPLWTAMGEPEVERVIGAVRGGGETLRVPAGPLGRLRASGARPRRRREPPRDRRSPPLASAPQRPSAHPNASPRHRYACARAAPWRSGYAAACKAVYAGSIPAGALGSNKRYTAW